MPGQVRVPVVWLTNEGGHDYQKAEKFGRLMPITTGSINPFNPDRLMVMVGNRLKVAAVEDYLVISGSPILNALALGMWLIRFGKCNVLLWSHRDSDYKHLPITWANFQRLAMEGITGEAKL